jgi:hypothetical protein
MFAELAELEAANQRTRVALKVALHPMGVVIDKRKPDHWRPHDLMVRFESRHLDMGIDAIIINDALR